MEITDIELKVDESPGDFFYSFRFSHQVDMSWLRLGQGQRGDLSEIISYTRQAHFFDEGFTDKKSP